MDTLLFALSIFGTPIAIVVFIIRAIVKRELKQIKYAGISLIAGIVLLVVAVAISPGSGSTEVASTTIQKEEVKPAPVKEPAKTEEISETKSLPSETKSSPKENLIAPDAQIEQYLKDRCGDVISDVLLDGDALSIFVDLSKGNLRIPDQVSKSGAVLQDVIITDEFLESPDFDEYWNTIVIDFGEVGKVNHDKGEISDLGNERHFIDVDYSRLADLDTNSDDKELDAAIQEVVDIIQENQQKAVPSPANDATIGEQNALKSAISYLNYSAYSYEGLKGQLEYEGYTASEQQYAVDNCNADWNEQALKSAKSYINYSAYSYTGLIEQLEFGEFTHEQAVYGADNCGADWNEQAARSAQSYLNYSSYSRDRLIEQLEYAGFTKEQAEYGVSAVGY